MDRDMDVLDFARAISMLQTKTPIADEFDRVYGQKRGRWWSCQREHLTVWCLFFPTPGVKGFHHAPSNSARKMYSNLKRPEVLLWLAEALGEERSILLGLVDEIKDKHFSTACSTIVKGVPFDRILELLRAGKYEMR